MRWVRLALLVFVASCGFDGEGTPIPDPSTMRFKKDATNADETMPVDLLVELNKPYDIPINVKFRLSGDAIPSKDYTASPGTITFQPGEVQHDIPIEMINDGLQEVEETIEVELYDIENALLDSDHHLHRITISNDVLPRVNFNIGTTTVGENNLTTIDLVLDKAPKKTVTVDVAVDTVNTTASNNNVDFELQTTTVTFQPTGALVQTLPFAIVNDQLDEDSETVGLLLTNESDGLAIGETSTRLHTITDDDDPPNVGFDTTTSTSNEGQNFTLTVNLSGPSGKSISVPFTRSGNAGNNSDATIQTSSPLVFTPGQVSKSITFQGRNDNADEPDETVVVTLDTPTNATLNGNTTRTHTIVDQDPPPSARLRQSVYTLDEGDSDRQTTFHIDLTGTTYQDITIPVTLTNGTAADDDRSINTTSVTISAGNNVGAFVITIKGDNSNESDETFTISLGTPSYGSLASPSSTAITIRDDDGGPPP